MVDIFQKHNNLNSTDKIDNLIAELRTIPGAMNKNMRQVIFDNIRRVKMQEYFKDNYEKDFSDNPGETCFKVQDNPPAPKISTSQASTSPSIKLPSDSLGSKKYIYGTYIEMAFHNFFLNLQHIYFIISGKNIMDEAKKNYVPPKPNKEWDEDFANEPLVWKPIFEYFRKCPTEERQKVEYMLYRHFPLLTPALDYTQNNPNFKNLDSLQILENISQSLRELRNYYLHSNITLYRNQIKTYNVNEELIAGILWHAYMGSKREVKIRFSFTEKEMHCAEMYESGPLKKDSAGKPIVRPDFEYQLCDKGTCNLTKFGLVSLCCLFLEKKYAKIFSDKTKCVKLEDQSVINEMIAVYRIRLYQEKLQISKNTDALALDILNELRRCPKELFELLTPDDQRKFRIKSDDNSGDSILMLRHRDRFTHLALKYIDEAELFKSIRFQVSLGDYFFKFYPKYCIDNNSEARVRALSKHINGFGRISEIEEKRTIVWDHIIRKYSDIHKNTCDESPYLTDHHAQYVVNGNRIAMRISNSSTHMPELEADGAHNLVPTCWMSTYELPAMMMLILLRDGSAVEEIIKNTVANYQKLFRDVADGILCPVENKEALQEILDRNYGHIKVENIPQDILQYLTSTTESISRDFNRHSASLIDKLIEQTDYLSSQFIRQCHQLDSPNNNKIGKRNYVILKPGRLAQFLAKDIMYFQPNNAENKGKLTSLNFRVLQSMLALYGTDSCSETDLERMFHAAHILGNTTDMMTNPIVMRLWNKDKRPTNIRELYSKYLEERKKYLISCKTKDPKGLDFLHPNRIRWQERNEEYYRTKAERFLHEESNGAQYDKSIELPRGLFDSYIREALRVYPAMQKDADDTTKNISYLIQGYFKHVKKEQSQIFYEADRNYPILNKLYNKSPRDAKVYYSAQQVRESLMRNNKLSLRKEIEKCISLQRKEKQAELSEILYGMLKNMKDRETLLKRYRVQDMVLYRIAMKLLMSEQHDNLGKLAFSKIKLQDITNKDVLSKRVPLFTVEVKSKKGHKKTIFHKDLKLKDYNIFYRIMRDRRVPSLLDHVLDSDIEHQTLEAELHGYDDVHPSILESVFSYENSQPTVNGQQSSFSTIVDSDSSLDKEDKSIIKSVRNAFAHMSYPPYRSIGEAQSIDIPEKAKAISKIFKEKISSKKQP